MTRLAVRFSNNVSHSSDGILNWESYHTEGNGATYTVFQLVFILRVTRAMYLQWPHIGPFKQLYPFIRMLSCR